MGDVMIHEYRISVRALVEYVHRSGSIDLRFRTNTSMAEGTKVHQKIQRQYAKTDQKELFLQTIFPYRDIQFHIEGRCDGLLFHDGIVTIDEIKSTSGELELITEDSYPVHWAQAKCYAYMYAIDHGIQEINVQLTYVQVDTEQIIRFKQTYTMEELRLFIRLMAEGYYEFAHWQVVHIAERNASFQSAEFPFEGYRKGQRKLAGAVYKTIAEGKSLFANAPTGIGKTVSTIFPSLKAVGEGVLEKLLYVTARTTTRQAAEDAFSLLVENGLSIKTVTITAKEKICFQETTVCGKAQCEFADGYYDRVNPALLDILKNENVISRETIESYARKQKLCPFEFSLDLAYVSDAIICDYNYVFDPRVSLQRLMEEQKKKTILLVDEAHNLVDRARSMFSAELLKSVFLQLKRQYKDKHAEIFTTSNKINQFFIDLKKRSESEKVIELTGIPEDLFELLEQFTDAAEQYLLLNPQNDADNQELLEAYFSAQNFIRISGLYDERFTVYTEISRKEMMLKIFCLDPSELLKKTSKRYRTAIHFSATLSPLSFFIDMLGGEESDYSISISSPFSPEQNEVYIKKVSTRYRNRESSKKDLVAMLQSLLTGRTGNYLVFFPSYRYMNQVFEDFNQDGRFQTIIQNPAMDDAARTAFLAAFEPGNESILIGFAVMGGIFSEGIDLKGDRLSGVVIVGVGMPQIGLERDIIKNYFESKGKNGFDYAYVYPGMNKVLQAGGRLIRSEDDHGLIVLADDRFLTNKYKKMLPENWSSFTII
ncbi:3'-5' exonuclease DinG [Bacillus sp. CECT 9360]|nr:3'-5' exonuclease DinG [Bacillus sp. CECT 9360]